MRPQPDKNVGRMTPADVLGTGEAGGSHPPYAAYLIQASSPPCHIAEIFPLSNAERQETDRERT